MVHHLTLLQSIVLGVVQGLTEFLPVSSTAHLVMFPWLAGWPEPGKAFDIALHIGTLVALVIYFRRDIMEVLAAKDKRLLWLIIAGCVPLIFVLPIEKKAEELSDPSHFAGAPLIIAGSLIVFAILLKYADARGRKKRPVESMSYAEAFFVGIGQIIAAILPGASRSGTTMTFGLFDGLTREATVRFSFLLSVPTIAGVALVSVLKNHRELAGEGTGVLLAGILASAIVGYMAIAFLMDYVRRKNMDVFFWYRIVAGLVILALYFMRK